ncbi:MAG: large conductance mechanosensitive channel protein MscL [Eubacterium sp.]|nr:large conductance mechanosensitive channel protein MscL [Eubacterium sp.]
MKKFIQEFKEFAIGGNVIDMAVGVVIGAAFKAIVDSLVADIISPIIGLFANKDLSAYTATIGDVEIRYGSFITAVINFIIMALVIFLLVKLIMKAKDFRAPGEEEAEPTEKECPYCKTMIPIGATRCGHCTSELVKTDF